MSKRLPYFIILSILAVLLVVGGGLAVLMINSSSHSVDEELTSYRRFAGCGELAAWLNQADSYYGYDILEDSITLPSLSAPFRLNTMGSDMAEAATSQEFSTTNVQVAGVDEADIVKTDGSYLYLVQDSDIQIVRVGDAGQLTEVSTISPAGTPIEMYYQDDLLIIFTSGYRNFADSGAEKDDFLYEEYYPYYGGDQQLVNVYVYDVADRAVPQFVRRVQIEGSYLTSRLVDGQVYIVSNFYSSLYGEEVTVSSAQNYLPQIADSESTGQEFAPIAECGDIAYMGNPTSSFMSIVTVPLESDELGAEVMLTNAENVYASTDHLYVVNTSYQQTETAGVGCGFFDNLIAPDSCFNPVSYSDPATSAYKFDFQEAAVEYLGVMTAPGTLLNQFSMDEHNGYFRMALTVGEVWSERSPSQNNLHIFDENRQEVSQVEGLGKGERIYSVRFMGDRAYVVTFKKVDPFYVIDLADPSNPQVLGELKIPGYSDYLHPYDENHIIGIGKNADDAAEGSFAWYQGLKIAIFDVTDPTNPQVLHQTEIGDRGSESEVLDNHKAFLFDRVKELMVIPASIAEVDESHGEQSASTYGDVVFRGFLVYKTNLTEGITEQTRISTGTTDDYWWYGSNGSRSLYIGDILVTFGNDQLQTTSLQSLLEIDKLVF